MDARKALRTPLLKREAALKAIDKYDISQRPACRLDSVSPKNVRREPGPDDPEISRQCNSRPLLLNHLQYECLWCRLHMVS
jgi:hypothetical protein